LKVEKLLLQNKMVLFEEKRVELLIKLLHQRKYNSIRALSQGIYSSDASCHKVLNLFEDTGLIYTEKKGRKAEKFITEKGIKVCECIEGIKNIMKKK